MEDPDQLKVLVLTSHYVPHALTSWQEAVVLMYTNKIDVIEEYDAKVSSPSVTIQVPAVVRLRQSINTHKSGIKFSRFNVYQRDRFRCCYCHQRKRPKELTYDHVLPRCRGGKTTWNNIVTACISCNVRKGRKTPEEAHMHMHFQPHKPSVGALPMSSAALLFDVDTAPMQWKRWLVSNAA